MCVIVSDLKCFFVNSVYTCVALVQVEKLVLLPLARGLVWFALFIGEAACLPKLMIRLSEWHVVSVWNAEGTT